MGKSISYNSVHLHYEIYGNGNKTLLSFHGFAQTHTIFENFVALNPNYTVYAFDLFFHGDSYIQNFDVHKDYKLEFIYLIKKVILNAGVSEVDILGYSIGARPALLCSQALGNIVNSVHLVAPDGVIRNPWFNFATNNLFGRGLFKIFTSYHKLLISFVKVFSIFFSFDKNTLRYIYKCIDSKQKITKLYNTWMLYAKYDIDFFSIAVQDNSKFKLILSKNDSIINTEQLVPKLEKHNFYNYEILKQNHYEVIKSIVL